MEHSNTCALITIDKDGGARVRTMDPFSAEEDFTVWFGTNPNSRKVGQIKQNSTITLYYEDRTNPSYVMLYGTAEIIHEPSKKETYWKEEWTGFYPDKTNGYTLIKFSPQWMEVVSESNGIVGDSIYWTPKSIPID